MKPWRRWAVTHKPLVITASGVLIVALAGGTSLVVSNVLSNAQRAQQEQAAAEAAAAAAQAQADQEAQAEREAQAEADRVAQLMTACDLSVPEEEIPDEVWIAWLACDDKDVVTQAVLKAPRDAIDPSLLEDLAKTSRDDEVATFISSLPNTPLSAHEALIAAWGPETVGRSYVVVYDQPCSTGVLPAEYIGRTTWRDDNGNVIEFITNRCSVKGISGSRYLSSSYRQSWSQARGSVSIGPVAYLRNGDTLVIGKDSPWLDSTSVPQRWAKVS